jgi:hypothetical protein
MPDFEKKPSPVLVRESFPPSAQKLLKSAFFDSLSFRKAANPLRPELYLIFAGIALLGWLVPPLQHFLFHWPVCIVIGLTGLMARETERRRDRATAAAITLNAPAPPVILQLIHDLTSCLFLVLPLTMAAAVLSPTMDLMVSLTEEVLLPLLNLRAVTSVCCWLVYRLVYNR